MVFFSIIIPVYNSEDSIGCCLNKLLKQTYHDFEIIIVNDGSKDNSVQIIESIILKNPSYNIKLICQDNAGAGAARNTGIASSKGKYIVFIDADDYVDDDFLEQTYKNIVQNDSDLIFIDIVREDQQGRIIRYERMSNYAHLSKDRMIRWQLTGKMPWGGVRKIARASLIKDNNIHYATEIKVGEESIYSFRLLDLANNVSFQRVSLYHYVDNSNSLTSNDVEGNSLAVYEFMTNYLCKNGQSDIYESTINAMAITTVAIACNVIFTQKGLYKGYNDAKELLKKFKCRMNGTIDKDALDKRVSLLTPWLRNGIVLPVWVANRLMYLIKRIK